MSFVDPGAIKLLMSKKEMRNTHTHTHTHTHRHKVIKGPQAKEEIFSAYAELCLSG